MNSVERSTFVVYVGAHSLLGGGGEDGKNRTKQSVKYTSYWELDQLAGGGGGEDGKNRTKQSVKYTSYWELNQLGEGGRGWKEPHEVEREVHQLLGVKSVSYLRSGKHQSFSGLPSAEVKKF